RSGGGKRRRPECGRGQIAQQQVGFAHREAVDVEQTARFVEQNQAGRQNVRTLRADVREAFTRVPPCIPPDPIASAVNAVPPPAINPSKPRMPANGASTASASARASDS